MNCAKFTLVLFLIVLLFTSLVAQDNQATNSKNVSLSNYSNQVLDNLPAPVIISPLNGSTNQSGNPLFCWSAVTGAASYRIMVATDANDLPLDPTSNTGGSSVVVNATPAETTFTPNYPLNAGVTYYWEVLARNSTQYGTWTSKYSFTTSTISNIVLGIDVSYYDGNIQWSNAANAGIQFTYIKATESTYSPDSKFLINSQGAVAQNIAVGAYHFATPLFSPAYYKPGYDHQNTVNAEVANFLSAARGVIGKDFLPPALDVEEQIVTFGTTYVWADPLDIMGAASLAQWIQSWAFQVFQQTNVMPIIYCDQTYAAQLSPYLKGIMKLWIADWSHPAGHPSNSHWPDWPWIFHQWTDLGILGGLNGVDEDVFNGSLETFKNLITSTNEIPVPAVPSNFSLSQNYPNPFNPNTIINYSLAKEGNVRIIVYNSLGSKVATLVDGFKPAGNYSVQFNGRNLASGMYVYRLESGNYSMAKKCILLK